MKKYESRTAGGAVAFADTGMMLTDKRLTGVDDASVLLLNIFECHASIIPVDRTRNLLPGNGDLRPQQDRKMGFCEFNQIRLICERTLRACLTASTPQMPPGYQPFDILQ